MPRRGQEQVDQALLLFAPSLLHSDHGPAAVRVDIYVRLRVGVVVLGLGPVEQHNAA